MRRSSRVVARAFQISRGDARRFVVAGASPASQPASHHSTASGDETWGARQRGSGPTTDLSLVHGVPNLFVAGASVFPTGGFVNPTLTVVALALRLADHLCSALSTLPEVAA